jgi:hypothetical protein
MDPATSSGGSTSSSMRAAGVRPRPLGLAFDAATIARVLSRDLAELALALAAEQALTTPDRYELARQLADLRDEAARWDLVQGAGDHLGHAIGIIRTTNNQSERQARLGELRTWIDRVKARDLSGVLHSIAGTYGSALEQE